MASFKGMQFGVGSALEKGLNFMRNRKQQRNLLDEAKQAAERENQRAENLGFEEQTTLGEEPVFETEIQNIEPPTGFSAFGQMDGGRVNLPQSMDMARMVKTIDVSDPNQVMAFQQAFNEMGGNLEIDGKFGPNTLAALRRAQGAVNQPTSRIEVVEKGGSKSGVSGTNIGDGKPEPLARPLY